MKVLMTQAYLMQCNGHRVKVIIQNNEHDSYIPEYDQLCEKMQLKYTLAQYPIATCIEEVDICKCMDCFPVIKDIVEKCAPDIIHSVQLNVTVELVARELKIPHLMNIYPITKGMFQIDWINVFPRYHSCDSIFFSEQWASGLGIESRCIRVAYEGSNESKLRKEGKYHLINIAVFTEYKRQLEIIKFVEYCRDRKIQLHITFLGDNEGEYGNKCKEYVRLHDLENEVTFVGRVLNVEDYLAQAELMIHASTTESYPGVVVEAMANKVCVLATPVGGIPELLVDGENGFLVEGYTYKDIYKCFERYIEYRKGNKINQIIENAYHTYLENHTYEEVTKQLENYYRYILENNKNKDWCVPDKTDIQQMFKSFMENCALKRISENLKRKVWFLYHVKIIVKEYRYQTALIWGVGMHTDEAIEWCSLLELDVRGIVDSYKQGAFRGYMIHSPHDFDFNNVDAVFVSIGSISGCGDVIGILEEKGKVRNRDFFLICNNPCISKNY